MKNETYPAVCYRTSPNGEVIVLKERCLIVDMVRQMYQNDDTITDDRLSKMFELDFDTISEKYMYHFIDLRIDKSLCYLSKYDLGYAYRKSVVWAFDENAIGEVIIDGRLYKGKFAKIYTKFINDFCKDMNKTSFLQHPVFNRVVNRLAEKGTTMIKNTNQSLQDNERLVVDNRFKVAYHSDIRSCMQESDCYRFYEANENVCQSVKLYRNGDVVARATLWDCYNDAGTHFTMLDRVYFIAMNDGIKLFNEVKRQGLAKLYRGSSFQNGECVDVENVYYCHDNEQIDFRIFVDIVVDDVCPYMDTFRYISNDGGLSTKACNHDVFFESYNARDTGVYIDRCPECGRILDPENQCSCGYGSMISCDCCGDMVDEGDSYRVRDAYDNYIYVCENCLSDYVNVNDEFYHIENDNICYDSDQDDWFLVEDCFKLSVYDSFLHNTEIVMIARYDEAECFQNEFNRLKGDYDHYVYLKDSKTYLFYDEENAIGCLKMVQWATGAIKRMHMLVSHDSLAVAYEVNHLHDICNAFLMQDGLICYHCNMTREYLNELCNRALQSITWSDTYIREHKYMYNQRIAVISF